MCAIVLESISRFESRWRADGRYRNQEARYVRPFSRVPQVGTSA
jgi:hypothetical protein